MDRNPKAASPLAGLRTGVQPFTKVGWSGVACPTSWKKNAANGCSYRKTEVMDLGYRIMIKDGSAIRPYPEACTECPLHLENDNK